MHLTDAVIEAIERVATDVVVVIDSNSVTAAAVASDNTHIVTGDDPYHAIFLWPKRWVLSWGMGKDSSTLFGSCHPWGHTFDLLNSPHRQVSFLNVFSK